MVGKKYSVFYYFDWLESLHSFGLIFYLFKILRFSGVAWLEKFLNAIALPNNFCELIWILEYWLGFRES